MIKTVIITLCLVLSCTFTAVAQYSQDDSPVTRKTVGFELDALPYATGGYYGSAWYGLDRLRFRTVVAKINTPSFALEDGYEDNWINAYVLLVDYFFDKNFRGFWVGAGFEYWDNEIEHEQETVTASYDNTIFTVGGGYVWKFHGNFYLNPWIAGHFIIAGDSDVQVGSRIFNPKGFTPEGSIKIGWHF